ncbi:MAG: type II 3-dehydroquinate dehydratase [Rhodospirillales bacterium]|jgi:3-dehydroquinate dehydratase-2
MINSILILNGPNLNMLGTREPETYGTETLGQIENLCQSRAVELGLTIYCRQSNSEGELINWIQKANENHAAIIINAGAYTHTSIAILDALRSADLPVIEVHLSNIFQREDYRHVSFVSKAADGVICGFGSKGYELALEAVAKLIS